MDGDGITFSYLINNCLIIRGFCKSEPEFITNWHKIVKISDVLRTIHMYVFCIFHMHFSLNTRSVISIFKFNTRSLPVSSLFKGIFLKTAYWVGHSLVKIRKRIEVPPEMILKSWSWIINVIPRSLLNWQLILLGLWYSSHWISRLWIEFTDENLIVISTANYRHLLEGPLRARRGLRTRIFGPSPPYNKI